MEPAAGWVALGGGLVVASLALWKPRRTWGLAWRVVLLGLSLTTAAALLPVSRRWAGRTVARAFSACFRAGGEGGIREKNEARRTTTGAETGVKPGRVELLSLGGEPRPRRWAVAGLVPFGPWPRWCVGLAWPPLWREERGYVTAILGSGGVGKSYLLLSLAMALLTGGEWLGRRVLRCRSVLYCDAELDVDTQRERGYQVARGLGLPRPPGPSRWWQLPWAWIRPWGLSYYRVPCSVGTPEGLALVARQVRRTRAECVLFDSLTIGAAGTALSDQNGWNAVLSGMEAWKVPTILIDHMGKAGNGGMVGSFMKQAKVRSAVELERQKDGAVTVEHAKSNFGPMTPAFTMRPVFEHCDAEDAEPGAVRFDVGRVAPGATSPEPGETSVALARPRWGQREQLVLEAFAARGAAGATVKEIAAHLGGAYKPTWEAAGKLEQAGALVQTGTLPTPGGGPPARCYVAAESPVTESRVDVVAQAEALLRSALEPSTGGPGGAGA